MSRVLSIVPFVLLVACEGGRPPPLEDFVRAAPDASVEAGPMRRAHGGSACARDSGAPTEPKFARYAQVSAPGAIEAVAIGDVTGDGRADVVATAFDDQAVYVFAQGELGLVPPVRHHAGWGARARL